MHFVFGFGLVRQPVFSTKFWDIFRIASVYDTTQNTLTQTDFRSHSTLKLIFISYILPEHDKQARLDSLGHRSRTFESFVVLVLYHAKHRGKYGEVMFRVWTVLLSRRENTWNAVSPLPPTAVHKPLSIFGLKNLIFLILLSTQTWDLIYNLNSCLFVYLLVYASKTKKKPTEPNPTKFCMLPKRVLQVWFLLGEWVQGGGKTPNINVCCVAPLGGSWNYKSSSYIKKV